MNLPNLFIIEAGSPINIMGSLKKGDHVIIMNETLTSTGNHYIHDGTVRVMQAEAVELRQLIHRVTSQHHYEVALIVHQAYLDSVVASNLFKSPVEKS